MSRELEEILDPPTQLPWEEAASFFVAIKDVTKMASKKEDEEGKVSKFLREERAKKAEMEKTSFARLMGKNKISKVRGLWKLAQGEGEPITDAEEGFNGVAPGGAPVEPAAIKGAMLPEAVPQKKKKRSQPPTPEDRRSQNAAEMINQEQIADLMSGVNEADYYRQIAEGATSQAQELAAALQEAQMALEQTNQQAQMSQMQADQTVQMAQQQAQSDAEEKQQLSDAGLEAKQNIMQMRQAMQSYRENLQQIALQDPTITGPSPEEQGAGPTPGELQSMMADQQMAKEDQAMSAGKQVPTAAPPGGGGDMAALEQEAAQEAAQEVESEKKTSKPSKKQEEDKKAPKVEVNVEKKGSAIPELLREDSFFNKKASLKERAIGAAIGAPLAAGVQSLSDIRRKGGESAKERALRSKLEGLKSKKDPGAIHKHKINMARMLYETAKTNREHPRSAAAIAALTGAGVGAAIGPDVGRGIKNIFQRAASRGGK